MFNSFSVFTWPTTSCRFEPRDVYICNSFLRVIFVMLNWIKVEQGQHLRYQRNMCCTHSATRGLKYMCYDVLCTVWACLWTFQCFSKCYFNFKCWFHNQINFQQLEGVTTYALNSLGNIKLYNMLKCYHCNTCLCLTHMIGASHMSLSSIPILPLLLI